MIILFIRRLNDFQLLFKYVYLVLNFIDKKVKCYFCPKNNVSKIINTVDYEKKSKEKKTKGANKN